MKRKNVLIITVCVGVGLVVYYRDLLGSAFARNPFPRSAESVVRGRLIYQQHCVTCHGASGRGDGPAATTFSNRMDDLSTLPSAPIFPDGVVVYRITNGGESMPAWKSVLTQNEVWDVLNFIRSLRASGKS